MTRPLARRRVEPIVVEDEPPAQRRRMSQVIADVEQMPASERDVLRRVLIASGGSQDTVSLKVTLRQELEHAAARDMPRIIGRQLPMLWPLVRPSWATVQNGRVDCFALLDIAALSLKMQDKSKAFQWWPAGREDFRVDVKFGADNDRIKIPPELSSWYKSAWALTRDLKWELMSWQRYVTDVSLATSSHALLLILCQSDRLWAYKGVLQSSLTRLCANMRQLQLLSVLAWGGDLRRTTCRMDRAAAEHAQLQATLACGRWGIEGLELGKRVIRDPRVHSHGNGKYHRSQNGAVAIAPMQRRLLGIGSRSMDIALLRLVAHMSKTTD
eukprot:1548167-Amphidinium_carterae.1